MDSFIAVLEAQDMFTVSKAQRVLGVSRQTMMEWLRKGKFPNAEKGDGDTDPWLIPESDVEQVRLERVAELQQQIEDIKYKLKYMSEPVV